ncbi:MAG: ISL3 family transposase [Candidatus Zixiibacteriota bacterium]
MNTEPDAVTKVLGIGGYRVTECEVSESEIRLRIERENPGHICPNCKQMILFCYDSTERTVKDLPMSGKPVYLTFSQHRIECPCSGRIVKEHLEFVEPYQHQTCRLQQTVYWWLRTGTTTSKAAKAFGLSWDQVRHIDSRIIKQEQGRQSWVGLRRICVDEKAIGRGHDYITIVSDLDVHRVVFVVEGRKKSSLNKFYRRIGSARCQELEVVAMDVWSSYIESTRKYAPQANIVFDKFHIIRHLNEKIDDVRRGIQKKLEKEGRQTIKRSRWVLLKANENLTDRQRERLDQIAKNNAELYKAYLLKEQFRLILEPTSLEIGMSRLAGWFAEVYESGIKPLIKFAQQCGRWFEGLMNYFKHGVTNALSESINSKISLMIKLANGFRNRDYFMLKIYQQCRDLG